MANGEVAWMIFIPMGDMPFSLIMNSSPPTIMTQPMILLGNTLGESMGFHFIKPEIASCGGLVNLKARRWVCFLLKMVDHFHSGIS